jgi:acetolactate synthase-1/2/3 large subunit
MSASDRGQQLHGGRLIARRLKAHGVSKLFTLSGGHLFSIYDGCRSEGIEIVDVGHEQTAAFVAEGWAKVTREIGVCALTAGPGVTNGMSAMASAAQNESPILVLGGRAPQMRWGQGSLQEIDHVPFVRPLVKLAATAESAAEIQGLVDDAIACALHPPGGPVFLDFPLDHVFSPAPDSDTSLAAPEAADGPGADLHDVERAGALLRDAERPVIMAGTGLYWGHGERALRRLAERLRIPVFLNGLARGCLPADHELCFSRARSRGLSEADVALVVGVPLDCRLGFGKAFADDAELIVIDAAEPERERPRPVAAELYGALPATLNGLTAAAARPRRDRRVRRRRLRVVCRAADRLLRTRLLAGSRPVRLPGLRPRLCPGGQAGPPGAPGDPAPGRRRVRLLRTGVRHAAPAQRPGHRRDRQQRHLGAGEAPDGAPVRVFGGRRADPGDQIRPDR